ncbi:hypothetical protein EYF80_021148 [Liparis tanakae]|uniref:Uncharacterized protein n=1 Tax=Liparis tanakae TaxID=230148 RepID=A0A4Z2HUF2_9TELE|nr:hypothetical protein EYF80_021148 [Liparis tanakae]
MWVEGQGRNETGGIKGLWGTKETLGGLKVDFGLAVKVLHAGRPAAWKEDVLLLVPWSCVVNRPLALLIQFRRRPGTPCHKAEENLPGGDKQDSGPVAEEQAGGGRLVLGSMVEEEGNLGAMRCTTLTRPPGGSLCKQGVGSMGGRHAESTTHSFSSPQWLLYKVAEVKVGHFHNPRSVSGIPRLRSAPLHSPAGLAHHLQLLAIVSCSHPVVL